MPKPSVEMQQLGLDFMRGNFQGLGQNRAAWIVQSTIEHRHRVNRLWIVEDGYLLKIGQSQEILSTGTVLPLRLVDRKFDWPIKLILAGSCTNEAIVSITNEEEPFSTNDIVDDLKASIDAIMVELDLTVGFTR